MGENCTHNCGSCSSSDCESRTKESMIEKMNEHSNIKKVIAVVSGKGGVGKTLVTTMLSVLSSRNRKNTAILDADITGPSIPKSFCLKDKVMGNEEGMLPAVTETGIEVMSVNLLLPNETDPVLWRGPVIANAVKQFWTDVVWGDVDYMFVDMPPGTGDVPLTVFQSLPVDGIIIVTSPQQLVSMIVEKAVKMAGMMKIPVLGIVENMSYFECSECKKKHFIFGESHLEEIAEKYNITNIARIPMNYELAKCCDSGKIDEFTGDWLDEFVKEIIKK
ncbi:MAG: Mrp/NBP35 family ATP-binding protein [Clostridiales bacterium]|nr:Mrp/NBP35 family ATP-binding protein [Clostridiales bacterium]